MKALIVRSRFGAYEAGSKITDPAEVAAVLTGENSEAVVIIAEPDPEPEAAPVAQEG